MGVTQKEWEQYLAELESLEKRYFAERDKGVKQMEETIRRLLRTTQGCRNDMHEPDEQGIKAVVSGYLLDNAFGDDPHTNAGEITIGIERDEHTEWFNLATLIALARTSKINHS